MTIDRLLTLLIELKLKHGGSTPVVMPQENLASVKSQKWIADISHVEIGGDEWDNWGNTVNKVVIF